MNEYLRMLLRIYTKLADQCGSVGGQTSVKPNAHRGLTSKLPRFNLGRTLKSPRSHASVEPGFKRGFC